MKNAHSTAGRRAEGDVVKCVRQVVGVDADLCVARERVRGHDAGDDPARYYR